MTMIILTLALAVLVASLAWTLFQIRRANRALDRREATSHDEHTFSTRV